LSIQRDGVFLIIVVFGIGFTGKPLPILHVSVFLLIIVYFGAGVEAMEDFLSKFFPNIA